ncbi:two-component sensor histidine kinase [Heyndrickxia sporothermodurans]|nr:two-component sensor histidine kinase [Heyndrickxia sporothermodurans]
MGIHTLLLNAFIIIICILSYQVFWLEKEEKGKKGIRNDLFISMLASIAIILCMHFPFKFYSGYIYDLRLIPILIVSLYGSSRSFVLISIVYLSYRVYLGGNGVVPSILVYLMIIIIILLFNYFSSDFFKKKKILFSTLLIFLCTISFSTFALFNYMKLSSIIDPTFLHFLSDYIIINTFTGLLSTYLIESMIEKYKMKEKIQRTEKFYAVSELAASIAHEIRNPLTTVYGFMQLFKENEISESTKKEYLQIMLGELERTQLIIDDYLSLAKPQMLMKEPIDINQIIDEIVHTISPLAMVNRVEIKSDIKGSHHINTDEDKIKQCLINIAKNGIEAMTNGGILQINVRKVKNNIVIDIIDNGIGMVPEEIKRIAMPFYSLKEKGTGLGTMVSYSIIKELNGDIEIKSGKGKGTCFSIILPFS